MGTMGDLVFFMTSEHTIESGSTMSNGAARPPLLLPNNETDKNIALPPSSSHHHQVVLSPGLRQRQGRGGEGRGSDVS
jgi:hypothetical protein